MSNQHAGYYIGLMSGTSMDGVDAALVGFRNGNTCLVEQHETEMPGELRLRIAALTTPGDNEIERLGQLDIELGKLFARATLELLDKAGISPQQIIAIGSHGQTIRHQPNVTNPFSLQIADPNTIAQLTGITTVADFRRRDMAASGQGAPLVPAFHARAFQANGRHRAILNIGGVANLTLLPDDPAQPIGGFDTGPGNGLLNSWILQHLGKTYDAGGQWSATGTCQARLLEQMLQDPYFDLAPPKSTGRQYFNPQWLEHVLECGRADYAAQDVAATLVELVAQSVRDALERHFPACEELYICGGGVHNLTLRGRIDALLPATSIQSTQALGVDPDWVEALAFAWLAKQTMERKPGNLPSVTGARNDCILGGVYYA